MPSSEIPTLLYSAVLGILPSLIFYTVVIYYAGRKLKNGGGRAERLLIVGSVILILNVFLFYALAFIAPLSGRNLLISQPYITGLIRDIITMSGVICFIYAFWLKFNARNSATTE